MNHMRQVQLHRPQYMKYNIEGKTGLCNIKTDFQSIVKLYCIANLAAINSILSCIVSMCNIHYYYYYYYYFFFFLGGGSKDGPQGTTLGHI